MYDYKTQNKSFLRMHEHLKLVNVSNNEFMLTLNDEGLQGVDPFDDSLSIEMEKRIIKESKENIWYFLREVVRVNTDITALLDPNYEDKGYYHIPYILTKATCAQAFCLYHGVDSWISSPRGTYKTISTMCLSAWELLRVGSVSIQLISSNQSENTLNKRIILPVYIIEEINNSLNDNTVRFDSIIKYNAFTESNKKETIIHITDAEFIDGIDKLYNYSKGKSIFLFESVFNVKYDKTGAKDIIEEATRWNEMYYDLFETNKNSTSTLMHIIYTSNNIFTSEEEDKDYKDMMRVYKNSMTEEAYNNEILLNRVVFEKPIYVTYKSKL